MIEIKAATDDEGRTVPHDNNVIGDDWSLIRRVTPYHIKTTPDGNPILDEDGLPKLSTMLMRASSGENQGMSVDLKELIESDDICPKEFVNKPKYIGAVTLLVSEVRDHDLAVGYSPEDDNPYHGEVWGKFTKGVQRSLLRKKQWYVEFQNI